MTQTLQSYVVNNVAATHTILQRKLFKKLTYCTMTLQILFCSKGEKTLKVDLSQKVLCLHDTERPFNSGSMRGHFTNQTWGDLNFDIAQRPRL